MAARKKTTKKSTINQADWAKVPHVNPSEGWTIETEIQVHNLKVVHGTELKIQGERHRFRFLRRVTTDKTSWIDVWGGPKGSENWRSFREDRIKRVHIKNKTDANLAKVHKEKLVAKRAERETEEPADG